MKRNPIKKEIITVILSAIISYCSYGQNEGLISDSLIIDTGCLGAVYKITIAKNIYSRHTIDLINGPSDTLIYLTNKQISDLNKQIKKVRKIKSRDRTKKIKYTCPCYRRIILYESRNKKDLGKYISSSIPPFVFVKLIS